MAEVVSVMETLEDIFSASFIKSGGHVPCPPPEVQALHATTLDCWSLLLSLLSPGEVHRRAGKWLKGLTSLLHSSDMELRVTAGESIALVLEFAFDYDEEYAVPGWDELVELLGSLAKDASKARSKRDRKEQRASFRDILRAVEDGDCPNESVKFGKEVLYLDSWYKKLQYSWFCRVLATGTNIHLSSNIVLRQIFELGAPLTLDASNSSSKPSKSERNAANQLAFKLRTQSRGKNRDKRSAVV